MSPQGNPTRARGAPTRCPHLGAGRDSMSSFYYCPMCRTYSATDFHASRMQLVKATELRTGIRRGRPRRRVEW